MKKEIRDLKAGGATVDKKRRSSSSTGGGGFWSTLTGRNSSEINDKESEEMVAQSSGWRRGVVCVVLPRACISFRHTRAISTIFRFVNQKAEKFASQQAVTTR